mgnify:FL=1
MLCCDSIDFDDRVFIIIITVCYRLMIIDITEDIIEFFLLFRIHLIEICFNVHLSLINNLNL